jgi:polysaccharide biosynthesis/export protein
MRLPLRYARTLQAMLLLILMASCVNTRQATYFDNVGSARFKTVGQQHPEPPIRPNDLLSISVSSPNPEASLPFNAPNLTATQASSAAGAIVQAAGYLVGQDGQIQFPFLGNIKAAGLTKSELQSEITRQLSTRQLLLEPIVSVRYLNYKVSVLGEVARPSVLTIPNERVSMLEAIGLAGDLTIYAKRDNVLLIRELEDGQRVTTRIDLTSQQLLTSPDYYLKPNDIIYVEPNKARVVSSGRAYQLLPIILSALSFTAIALDRLLR